MMKPAASPVSTVVAKSLRRLEWNELVRRGDFVEDGRQGFELWEGPSGFRADAFVKTIYRKLKERVAGALKIR
jgi:hypothetical protein